MKLKKHFWGIKYLIDNKIEFVRKKDHLFIEDAALKVKDFSTLKILVIQEVPPPPVPPTKEELAKQVDELFTFYEAKKLHNEAIY